MKKASSLLKSLVAVTGFVSLVSCGNSARDTTGGNYPQGSFGYDLHFLQQKDDVVVLGDANARVIVSPKFQGKVFTSSSEGASGMSFGWINYDAFDSPTDPHMNAYGGENRFWLGPEGNKFSLFFPPSAPMTFENWKTPAPVDTEPWTVESKDERSVAMAKDTELSNYAGTTFKMSLRRSVTILPPSRIEQTLGITLDKRLKTVGYETVNEITNTGDKAWSRETGAPCIWILDMFNPSPSTVILIPFRSEASGKIVTTDYFGEIPPDRISVYDQLILFKADGNARGKIGVSPARAKTFAGSYDEEKNILTVVTYDVDPSATYLNQEWNTTANPFSGDAVNAYNDGPLEDGSQMGPFYELESVSPAAFLSPGEKLSHRHSVFHFSGAKEEVRELMSILFGITDPSITRTN